MSPPPSRSPSPTTRAMAQTMGFSTFGSQLHPPRKKQKVNSSTGGNSVALGMRSRKNNTENEEVAERVVDGHIPQRLKDDVSFEDQDIDVERRGETNEDNHHTLPIPPANDGQSISNTPVFIRPPHLPNNVSHPLHHPSNPPHTTQHLIPGQKADGTWDWQALRRGVRDENGDMAFYDGSFVEDAWRGLR